MRYKALWSLLFMVTSYTAMAADLPGNFDANVANSALQPLMEALQPFLQKLSLIVGGIFGLYVILILVRIYYDRKTLKILQGIRYDLDHLNRHYNLPTCQDKRGIWKRLFSFLFSRHGEEQDAKKKKLK